MSAFGVSGKECQDNPGVFNLMIVKPMSRTTQPQFSDLIQNSMFPPHNKTLNPEAKEFRPNNWCQKKSDLSEGYRA
jgi:hypothetical protein